MSAVVAERADTARPAATSTSPGPASVWRRSRGPVAGLLLLVGVAAVLGAVRAAGSGGEMDPRSYEPKGTRAITRLLTDRGVPVRLVTDLPALQAALHPTTTVLVARPELLTAPELSLLGALFQPVVVVGAGAAQVEGLHIGASVSQGGVAVHPPGCTLPVAVTAGAVTAGGRLYTATPGTTAVGCYAVTGTPSLLQLPNRRLTLLGGSDLLGNARLAEQGNAALALGLLGGGEDVVWLLPSTTRDIPGGRRGLGSLVPDAVPMGALELAVAVVLLALWRARRLGRVVVEPLPVVVRAAEAVEGRGRLYRAARARDQAAEALRAAARDRLLRGLGMHPGSGRSALVAAVAARPGRDAAAVDALLYGPVPGNDDSLVRLADDLDRLVL